MTPAWAAAALILAPAMSLAGAFSVEEALEARSRSMWHAGGGLVPGDSFTYAVCDHGRKFDAPPGPCYEITLDFYAELESAGRDTWVAQATVSGGGGSRGHVFLVDSATLDIETDGLGAGHAGSVRDTVLYLAGFAREGSPRPLAVGTVWGSVDLATGGGSDLVVRSWARDAGLGDVFLLEYGLLEKSSFRVARDLPLPVSGIAHGPGPDPRVLFSFELLEHPGSGAVPGSHIAGPNSTVSVIAS